jgi:hypothetical protein
MTESSKDDDPSPSPLAPSKDVARDAPIRLGIAARLAFPDGSMKISGLRREAARGRLVVERIAGKDYTTLAHIERMRTLCRRKVNRPASGYEESEETTKAESSPAQTGSSSTTVGRSPQDALRLKLRKPRLG